MQIIDNADFDADRNADGSDAVFEPNLRKSASRCFTMQNSASLTMQKHLHQSALSSASNPDRVQVRCVRPEVSFLSGRAASRGGWILAPKDPPKIDRIRLAARATSPATGKGARAARWCSTAARNVRRRTGPTTRRTARRSERRSTQAGKTRPRCLRVGVGGVGPGTCRRGGSRRQKLSTARRS